MTIINKIKSVNIPSMGNMPIIEGGANFTHSGKTRTFVRAERPEDSGYTESHSTAKLSLSLILVSAIDLQAFEALEPQSITITLSDNQTYVMTNAWLVESPSVSKSQTEVQFESIQSIKL